MLNRKYIAQIRLSKESRNINTGALGETIFKYWFGNNFNNELLHKQKADMDYNGIDFVDEKGYKYQVKATRARSYTFNCKKENIEKKLNADFYVFIQIKEECAYIEGFYDKEYINSKIVDSFKNGNSFIYAKDLYQQELNLNNVPI